MSVNDFPDWQGASRLPGYMVLGSYENEQRFYLLPSKASVPEESQGKPGFFLSPVFDSNEADPEKALYWMIHLQLQLSNELDAATKALEARTPGATLSPLAYSPSAYWSLEASQLDAPIVNEFAWIHADETLIYQRLPQTAASIIYHGLESGVLAATFAIQYEVVGMAPRVPMTVTLDTHHLLDALRSHSSVPEGIPRRDLLTFLESNWQSLFQTSDPAPEDLDALTKALAARIRMSLGFFAPTSSSATGPLVGLLDKSAVTEAEMRWDLATPTLEARPMMAICDPFEAARAIVGKEGIDAITFPQRIPPLPSNQLQERVRVSPILPSGLANVVQANVEFMIERQYRSPNHIDLPTFSIAPVRDTDPVVLNFADPDKKFYKYKTVIVTTIDAYQGALLDHQGDLLVLDINAFDARFVIIDALASLLAIADIEIQRDGASAHLDTNNNTATFVLPEVSQPDDYGRLVVISRSRDDDELQIETDILAISTSLDASAFPSYGQKQVSVHVDFGSDSDVLILEIEPEGSSTSAPWMFAADTPSRRVSYMCPSLFYYRYRYRFRVSRASANGEWGDWSEYLEPSAPLALSTR